MLLNLGRMPIAAKFEFHFTPKQGSWLNLAELEFAVLGRSVFKKRIETVEPFKTELDGRCASRNADGKPVEWGVTSKKARGKMTSTYNVITFKPNGRSTSLASPIRRGATHRARFALPRPTPLCKIKKRKKIMNKFHFQLMSFEPVVRSSMDNLDNRISPEGFLPAAKRLERHCAGPGTDGTPNLFAPLKDLERNPALLTGCLELGNAYRSTAENPLANSTVTAIEAQTAGYAKTLGLPDEAAQPALSAGFPVEVKTKPSTGPRR